MADIDCDAFDAESFEGLFEPTVEVPAVLLLTAGRCCCPVGRGRTRCDWLAQHCC